MSHVKSIQKKQGSGQKGTTLVWAQKNDRVVRSLGTAWAQKLGDQEKDKTRVSHETLDLRLVLEQESLVPTEVSGQYFKSWKIITD